MLMKKYFITGIGTDVGKTLVSAILAEALKADYWKPIQSGSYPLTDTELVQSLLSNSISKVHPEKYAFKQPVSPHAAAEAEGVIIQPKNIVLPETSNTLLIEGAGGVLVPITDQFFIVDLIKKMEAEVIVVIRNYLGSINHSLLTIEALKNRDVGIKGLVINGLPNEQSERIILAQSKIPLIFRLLPENKIDKEMVKRYTDKINISAFC